MKNAQPMLELWRGGRLESHHAGHAVIWGEGGVVESWGDAGAIIFPRSSCKMIQALPLVESGAFDAARLTPRHLALSCASHQGAALHVEATRRWLEGLGLSESDLRCGSHEPYDRDERNRLIRAGEEPCQLHNNCSGKHCGFLTMTRHMKTGPDYEQIDHPLQKAIRQATEEVTGEAVAGYGIDGCSAPNFAMSLAGLARAMQAFAAARDTGDGRQRAMARLRDAMAAHPEMVAGEGRACTELMRAMRGRVAIKTGAEAVFVAMIPEKKLGIALKIADGGTRAAEAAIVALLVRLGMLDAAHPLAQKRLPAVQKNWRGLETGELRLSDGFA
ncbi:MAG: asparaginase [Pseudotabrizicola sp.]|uniref:asparaginase n=1 Tax=Pseudotabrizicola sp. TaxID=2939647 RepID=UPI00272F86E7|nr:asparaginase [Pseudotabrizicola sp.]MDP2081876.1 asparaginase [Pseudotabrizicola sp.]MDZ7573833.1 asparaginase [Pseudotabrizicola sp.]